MIDAENGCVEVDVAAERPSTVFIAGPIKVWWQPGNWDTDDHRAYMAWRERVWQEMKATGVIMAVCPWRGLQGAWHPSLQEFNEAHILLCDVFVDLTPDDIVAQETWREGLYAAEHGKVLIRIPPESLARLWLLLFAIWDAHQQKALEKGLRTMTTWRPDWSVPPGDILQDMMNEQHVTVQEVAQKSGIAQAYLEDILGHEATIDPVVALGLEDALGTDAMFWLNLENHHQIWELREGRKARDTQPENLS